MVRSFVLFFSKNLRMVVQDSIPPRRTVPDSVRTAAPVRRDVLVMAPADSAAQAFFGGEPAILRKFVPESTDHSVTVPAFRPADAADVPVDAHLWSPLADSLQKATPSHRTMAVKGVAGDPVPYRLRHDDIVTSTLLVSFVLMMWVIAASWKFLRVMVKDFFYHRIRPNLFADRVDTELRGRFFLVAQTCFLQGILFVDYVQDALPETFEQASPYGLLAIATTVVGIYYLSKLCFYNFVNSVFFDAAHRRLWNDTYFVSILLIGVILLPLTLLVVFFDLPFSQALSAYVLLMAFVKILLLYKANRIFFSSFSGSLHVILYFCALEIAPLLFAWGLLETITQHWMFPL